ncbi:c-type cytochrome [Marinicella rhabdoformis]|uniref:c-type cytochrome n=1 Tax=Marinicella rhabdoformis TaxID=2580566 RepID=UPI0012AED76F|nr:cytochrome c [Marinicella rhabdoformis]
MKKLLLLSMVLAFGSQAADVEKGKAKAEQVCKTCHGMDGMGIDATYPKLAGQFADYMEKSLQDYRSGDRANPIMAGFAATLTDEDIANVALYYSSLKENRLSDLSIK